MSYHTNMSTGERKPERTDHHGGGEGGGHHQGRGDAGGQGGARLQAKDARDEEMRSKGLMS